MVTTFWATWHHNPEHNSLTPCQSDQKCSLNSLLPLCANVHVVHLARTVLDLTHNQNDTSLIHMQGTWTRHYTCQIHVYVLKWPIFMPPIDDRHYSRTTIWLAIHHSWLCILPSSPHKLHLEESQHVFIVPEDPGAIFTCTSAMTCDTIVRAPLGLLLLLRVSSNGWGSRMATRLANTAASVLSVALVLLLLLLLGAPPGTWPHVYGRHSRQVLRLHHPGVRAGERSRCLLSVTGSASLHRTCGRGPGPRYRAPDVYVMQRGRRVFWTGLHRSDGTPTSVFASATRYGRQGWLLVVSSRGSRHTRPWLL